MEDQPLLSSTPSSPPRSWGVSAWTVPPRRWLSTHVVSVAAVSLAVVGIVGVVTGGEPLSGLGHAVEGQLASSSSSLSLNSMASATSSGMPNIVVFLFDDVGYNDLGYHSYDLSVTPNIDALATDGVQFERYYAMPDCTPGRSALLSGRLPISSGMGHSIVELSSPWGLPLEHELLPAKLQAAGYTTHMLGKWDIGHYTKAMWPTERGFDSFFGLLGLTFVGSDGYSSHMCTSRAYDLHDGFENAYGYDGNYSTTLFGDKAVTLINDHDSSSEGPLFLYFAFNGLHAPVSIPTSFAESHEYAQLVDGIPWSKRQTYAGALYLADEVVGHVVTALQKNGLYDNSVIALTSDNGAPSSTAGGPNGGSSWPLRGYKGNVYEGGVRVPAFIHSPLLPDSSRGMVWPHLVHVTDWLPTLVDGAAGVDSGVTDGISMWPAVMGQTTAPLRNETLLFLDYFYSGWGGIIVGDYKFLKQGCEVWYTPNGTAVSHNGETCDGADDDDATTLYRVYDLKNDPTEQVNLYSDPDYADVVDMLLTRYCYYYDNKMVDSAYRDLASSDALAAMQKNDWFLTFWDESLVQGQPVESQYPMANYDFSMCDRRRRE